MIRDIFMLSNDVFFFFDKFVELNSYCGNVDILDFHRFQAVFHRLMLFGFVASGTK